MYVCICVHKFFVSLMALFLIAKWFGYEGEVKSDGKRNEKVRQVNESKFDFLGHIHVFSVVNFAQDGYKCGCYVSSVDDEGNTGTVGFGE